MSNFYTISTDNPKGIKTIEQDNKQLEAFAFPRNFLDEFKDYKEAKKPGIYILYNTADKNEVPIIYIGQSGSSEGVYSRLSSHNKNKGFWNYAICFVTKDDSLEMTHAKYIESRLIDNAIKCKVVDFDNATGSNTPPTNKHTKHLCDMWISDIIDIANILGLPFFNDTIKPPVEIKSEDPPVIIPQPPVEDRITIWNIHTDIKDYFIKNNCIAIGWNELGDLKSYNSKEDIKEKYVKVFPDRKTNVAGIHSSMLFKFANNVKPNDIVLYRNGEEIHIGKIQGNYEYHAEEKEIGYCNWYKVDWFKTVNKSEMTYKALHEMGRLQTFTQMGNNYEDFINIINK